jgi:uncharacterized protein
VHISQLADRFVKNAADVVKVSQRVEVTVVEVDVGRKRIGLTMRKQGGGNAAAGGASPKREGRKGSAGKVGAPAEGWFSAALNASKGR